MVARLSQITRSISQHRLNGLRAGVAKEALHLGAYFAAHGVLAE
jgi:hypothetical protein